MTNFQALLLGIVQGLTEFLPISSSGHLTLSQHLLGLQNTPLYFDVLLHTGTLVAVLYFFRIELIKTIQTHALYVLVATLPAVIAGVMLEPIFSHQLKQPWVVGIGLLITSMFLFSTKKTKPTQKQKLTTKKSLIIGLSQAIAIIPGISRSGSTVSTGMNLGIPASKAFSFSFILSIPAIFGAMVLELMKINNYQDLIQTSSIIGFTSAALAGLLALRILQYVIGKSKLYLFGYYCIGLGIITLLLTLN